MESMELDIHSLLCKHDVEVLLLWQGANFHPARPLTEIAGEIREVLCASWSPWMCHYGGTSTLVWCTPCKAACMWLVALVTGG